MTPEPPTVPPSEPVGRRVRPSDVDYGNLLAFRSGLRRFLRWSESAARDAGLNPAVHQLLLTVRGCGIPEGPRIGEVAQYLVVRHHTAVEVINRAEKDGLVRRVRDEHDSRAVRIQLTPEGLARLDDLTGQHLDELRRLSPTFSRIWQGLDDQ